jgi:hypothetical protein
MAARRTSLGHCDLATHPSAGMLDRLTWSWVVWLSQLEKVENVLCARCRPKSEEMVIRVGEGPPRRIVTKRGSRTFGMIMFELLSLARALLAEQDKEDQAEQWLPQGRRRRRS